MENMNNQPNPTDRHARTLLHPAVHDRLRHLAFDLHTSLAALLAEDALLVLRYHDRAQGLPEPMPPLTTSTKKEEVR